MRKYSQLRDSKRAPLEDLLPLEFPLSMFIETTNRCNFRCRYCPNSMAEYADIAGGFRSMSLPEFEKVCRDIRSGGRLKVLRFYLMGEPLLNPHLPQMMQMASRMKLAERTELTSNGTLLDADKSKAIIDSGLDYLRISISSVDEKRHEHITQTKTGVNQIYENIKRFKEIRMSSGSPQPFLYLKMIDSGNDDENSRFLDMYGAIADEAVIEKPMNWNGYNSYDFLQAAYDNSTPPQDKELYPYPKEVCPYPFYTLVVNVNGDVTVCCVDWSKATCIGNVFTSPLKSLWQGEVMRDFRRMHISRQRQRNDACRHCQFLFVTPDNVDHLSEAKIKEILGP